MKKILMKPTFCAEISFKMRKKTEDFIKTIESHYTAFGVRTVIEDKRDGQKYVLEIKPLQE